ncbi:flagellar motor switch protein FliN [Erwinia sp. S43]|uniref:Flagellar motor switch protein FliN n=1 Tax=Pantoea coffeiphila TaxID=1465635 RepID=A0A2S9IHT1_9GAMM|nr:MULTISPECIES: flagellar motor switch protein FliN [Erwiniaceae]MBK0032053.1 flagellar motor switch protein FliN [Erwinia sp. S43]PRD17329.1 flagellar motor switch protein FliN [Pantoea coffeiphila]
MTEVNIPAENALDFDFSLDDATAIDTQDKDDADRHAVQREKQRHLSLFSRIPVTLTLEVASVEISLAELIGVNNDSVLELDKMAGEPLDVKVNGILLGKAEVVVLNDKYGLRIIEFNNKELGELAL